MILKVEQPGFVGDYIKWLVVLFLLIIGVGGYYYFQQYPLYLRVLGEIVFLGVSLYFASKTKQGARAYAFWHAAKIEILKVVWPTREETTKLTMLVLAIVVILSLLLWLLDAVLAKIITSLIDW